MAKIDTSTIAGFESMTDAEKVAALTGLEIPEGIDKTKWVPKATLDAKLTELADVTKKLRGKMTEDEQAAVDRAAKEAADKAERDALLERCEKAEKALQVAGFKNQYLSLGYEEKLAQETAEALAAGKHDVVFANGLKHKTALEAKLKAELMDQDRKPGGGGDSGNKEGSDVAQAKAFAKAQADGNKALHTALDYYK